MAGRKKTSDLVQQRDEQILEAYNKMYWGEMKREEAIWPELEQRFFLKQKTLYKIVLAKSKEKANQNTTANECDNIQSNQQ